MFRKITIRNFKSLADVSTELGPFTVLVGKNGSGKSSFLQAIDLASWAVKYDSLTTGLQANDVDFRDIVYLRAPRSIIRLEAELTVSDATTPPGDEVVQLVMNIKKRRYVYVDSEVVRSSSNTRDDTYEISSEKRCRSAMENGHYIYHENVALGHSMLRDVYFAQSAKTVFPILKQVADHFMSYVHYEIWGPENLRIPSRLKHETEGFRNRIVRLGSRGQGLPTLLYAIRENTERWSDLMRELQEAYPAIAEILFRRGLEQGELGLQFVERAGSSKSRLLYLPSQMSDGFLRILALLAIKYQPKPLKLLGYEEPENGLHPSALTACMRHFKEIARAGTQVIVITHSPDLLNQVLEDDAEPKAQLRLVLRDDQGRTTIANPDPEKIATARRHGYGIGELWGMLLSENEIAQN